MTNPAGGEQDVLRQAAVAFRRGQVEAAISQAGRYIASASPGDQSGHVLLGQMLLNARRLDELQDLLELADGFRGSPEGRILQAGVWSGLRRDAEAEVLLRELARETLEPRAARIVGFRLIEILDRRGAYDEAWSLAVDTHRRSTRPYPVDALVAGLRITAQASPTEFLRLRRADTRVTRVCSVLGMPRSGTSLVEHMLDSHTYIRGLHELPMPGQMADAIAREGGGWPGGVLAVSTRTLNQLQASYLQATRELHQLPPDVWMLDKTVFPMMQPLFLATTLPGARVLHVQRAPRDNAVSLFLNNMDPSWGWTGNLDTIRQVLEAERRYLPAIMEKVQLEFEAIRYETLVRSPRPQIESALRFLDLPFQESCLHPEANTRLVHTLSEQQVHQPITDSSIDRWQNYARYFGPEWETLDAL